MHSFRTIDRIHILIFLCLTGLHLFLPGRVNATVIEKISPSLLHRMADYPKLPVIILGKTQLFEHAGDFRAFLKNNKKKRTELRGQLIEKLKNLGVAEQERIISNLGLHRTMVRLWIVNGIGTVLSRKEIRKAAAMDSVKYIYADDSPLRRSGVKTKGMQDKKETARRSFSIKGKKIPWYIRKIQADRVWNDFHITGEHIVVAVFDTGVNYLHGDLFGNLWKNSDEIPDNGIDDDRNGFADDFHGYNFTKMTPDVRSKDKERHGTFTSGIIAGNGTGGIITGIAPSAEIMILKASGSHLKAALAFQYALENGADIMNMSFSRPNLGQERGFYRMLAENALCAGLVLVSGAGNFGKRSRAPAPVPVQLRIPEGIPCVIAAGGITRNMKVPDYVSQGPVEWSEIRFFGDYPLPTGLIKPDIVAFPGPNYPLLSPSDNAYIDPNRQIGGNSFSGAQVSGVAALILSAAPDTPAWKVKEIIESTATPIDTKEKNNRTGSGLVNAFEAVRTVLTHGGKGNE